VGARDGAVAVASVAEPDVDSAGTGTVIRADTVRTYAAEAGCSDVDELSIEHEFWRFYQVHL
jgi:hypothetical protein